MPSNAEEQIPQEESTRATKLQNDCDFSFNGVSVTSVDSFRNEVNFLSNETQNQHDTTESEETIQVPLSPVAKSVENFESAGNILSDSLIGGTNTAESLSNQTECRNWRQYEIMESKETIKVPSCPVTKSVENFESAVNILSDSPIGGTNTAESLSNQTKCRNLRQYDIMEPDGNTQVPSSPVIESGDNFENAGTVISDCPAGSRNTAENLSNQTECRNWRQCDIMESDGNTLVPSLPIIESGDSFENASSVFSDFSAEGTNTAESLSNESECRNLRTYEPQHDTESIEYTQIPSPQVIESVEDFESAVTLFSDFPVEDTSAAESISKQIGCQKSQSHEPQYGVMESDGSTEVPPSPIIENADNFESAGTLFSDFPVEDTSAAGSISKQTRCQKSQSHEPMSSKKSLTEENESVAKICAVDTGIPEPVCEICNKVFKSRNMQIYQDHVCVCPVDTLPFPCSSCNARFKSQKRLWEHDKHCHDKPFSCSHCKIDFKVERYLKRHMEDHSKSPFPCDECCSHFKFEDQLKTHLAVHVERRFICQVCLARYASLGGLQVHMAVHIESLSTVTCNQCFARFKSKKLLEQHIVMHLSGALPFACKQCFARYANMEELKHHLAVHGNVQFTCDRCSAPFETETLLEEHSSTHLVLPFFCHCCPARFETEEELMRHSSHHGNHFKCRECTAQFGSLDELKQHSAIHSRLFPCDKCSAEFRNEMLLRKHSLIHNNKYVCKQCSKHFPSGEKLKEHYKTHPVLFPCKVCSQRFKRMRDLWKHAMTHCYPFLCKQCGGGFKTGKDLQEHMSFHDLFTCDLCRKRFKSESGLQEHMECHSCQFSDRRSYSCKVCLIKFDSEFSLSKHALLEHLNKELVPVENSQQNQI